MRLHKASELFYLLLFLLIVFSSVLQAGDKANADLQEETRGNDSCIPLYDKGATDSKKTDKKMADEIKADDPLNDDPLNNEECGVDREESDRLQRAAARAEAVEMEPERQADLISYIKATSPDRESFVSKRQSASSAPVEVTGLSAGEADSIFFMASHEEIAAASKKSRNKARKRVWNEILADEARIKAQETAKAERRMTDRESRRKLKKAEKRQPEREAYVLGRENVETEQETVPGDEVAWVKSKSNLWNRVVALRNAEAARKVKARDAQETWDREDNKAVREARINRNGWKRQGERRGMYNIRMAELELEKSGSNPLLRAEETLLSEEMSKLVKKAESMQVSEKGDSNNTAADKIALSPIDPAEEVEKSEKKDESVPDNLIQTDDPPLNKEEEAKSKVESGRLQSVSAGAECPALVRAEEMYEKVIQRAKQQGVKAQTGQETSDRENDKAVRKAGVSRQRWRKQRDRWREYNIRIPEPEKSGSNPSLSKEEILLSREMRKLVRKLENMQVSEKGDSNNTSADKIALSPIDPAEEVEQPEKKDESVPDNPIQTDHPPLNNEEEEKSKVESGRLQSVSAKAEYLALTRAKEIYAKAIQEAKRQRIFNVRTGRSAARTAETLKPSASASPTVLTQYNFIELLKEEGEKEIWKPAGDFIQHGDIDLSDYQEYLPLPVFRGRYDGLGFSIKGINVQKMTGGASLFSGLAGGRISNIIIRDSHVGGSIAGLLAADIQGGEMSNIVVVGDNRINTSSELESVRCIDGQEKVGKSSTAQLCQSYQTGGLAGRAIGSTFKNIFIENMKAGEGHFKGTAGGIVGSGKGNRFSNIIIAGTEVSAANPDNAGYIIGGGGSNTIEGFYIVKGENTNQTGQIVGSGYRGSIKLGTMQGYNAPFYPGSGCMSVDQFTAYDLSGNSITGTGGLDRDRWNLEGGVLIPRTLGHGMKMARKFFAAAVPGIDHAKVQETEYQFILDDVIAVDKHNIYIHVLNNPGVEWSGESSEDNYDTGMLSRIFMLNESYGTSSSERGYMLWKRKGRKNSTEARMAVIKNGEKVYLAPENSHIGIFEAKNLTLQYSNDRTVLISGDQAWIIDNKGNKPVKLPDHPLLSAFVYKKVIIDENDGSIYLICACNKKDSDGVVVKYKYTGGSRSGYDIDESFLVRYNSIVSGITAGNAIWILCSDSRGAHFKVIDKKNGRELPQSGRFVLPSLLHAHALKFSNDKIHVAYQSDTDLLWYTCDTGGNLLEGSVEVNISEPRYGITELTHLMFSERGAGAGIGGLSHKGLGISYATENDVDWLKNIAYRNSGHVDEGTAAYEFSAGNKSTFDEPDTGENIMLIAAGK